MQTGLAVFFCFVFFLLLGEHSSQIKYLLFFFFSPRLFWFGPKFSDGVILLFLLICFSHSGKNPRPEAISRNFNWESNYGISVPFLFFFEKFPPPSSVARCHHQMHLWSAIFFFFIFYRDFCEQCSLRDRGSWSTTLDGKKTKNGRSHLDGSPKSDFLPQE